MGLTQKILLFTGLLVVILVAGTLAYTTFQAERLAHQAIDQGLAATREVWETFQADRYAKLKLGVRAVANDPYFKAGVETHHEGTVLDMLKERGLDLKADFFIATDADGIVVARSDRPGAQGEDLSETVVVAKALEGEESATIWGQGDRLFHAVSVPMQTGPELKGVLIAGYAINEALAGDIRKLTHSEIAYLSRTPGGAPRVSVSSLGPREAALREALGRPEFSSNLGQPFQVELGGERHVAIVAPLKAASGQVVGDVVALRSLAVELAAFRQFRTSLVLVALGVMVAGLLLAFVAARRITDPVRLLVSLVDRARDGAYTGKVVVQSRDEIGVLARAFNNLLADLREKEQMIAFLREGLTLLRKGTAAAPLAGISGVETAAFRAAASGTLNLADGTLFASRYQIIERVGQGGMGVVFRARDRKLDEEVALKVLRPDVLQEDPSLVERFKLEIKLARRITHRNVLRTHDFDEYHGTPYISMEYLEGVTLKDLIRSKGALPVGVGLRVAKQVCLGLEAAHAEGVVHRDIKPQNLLIVPETGNVKIMDFGIARVSAVKDMDSGMTLDGSVVGTPDYMAPEQAQGRPADFRSDIYALGVVLYEIFTGSLPFSGESVTAVLLGHIQKPAPSARRSNPVLPADLDATILRCMEKDPARRYARVADLLEDLTAVSSRLEPRSAA